MLAWFAVLPACPSTAADEQLKAALDNGSMDKKD